MLINHYNIVYNLIDFNNLEDKIYNKLERYNNSSQKDVMEHA